MNRLNRVSPAMETIGALFGIAGALMLAIPALPDYWWFGAFLVCDLCWLVSSLLGLWSWWLRPLLLG